MKQGKNPKRWEQSVFGAHLGAVHMDISGNREVVFEGNKGILEYHDRSIKINAGKYIVAFSGRGLHIAAMTDTDIVIHGFITSIEYII